jgi:hypothetical protein
MAGNAERHSNGYQALQTGLKPGSNTPYPLRGGGIAHRFIQQTPNDTPMQIPGPTLIPLIGGADSFDTFSLRLKLQFQSDGIILSAPEALAVSFRQIN